MAVCHRFTCKYGGAEMLAPFFMEATEHRGCFSFGFWLLDKPVFVGNTQGWRWAPPRANPNGKHTVRKARHESPTTTMATTYYRNVICLITFLECGKWGIERGIHSFRETSLLVMGRITARASLCSSKSRSLKSCGRAHILHFITDYSKKSRTKAVFSARIIRCGSKILAHEQSLCTYWL